MNAKFGFNVLALALILQFFHLIEHAAQVYQHWWLALPIKESKGILFFLDLEWNHLAFNALYLIFLFAAWFLLRGNLPRGSRRLLFAGAAIQSYHTVEHGVRIVQHLQTACEPCTGILGRYVDGVYLHFAFNAVVFALPLLVFAVLMSMGKGGVAAADTSSL